MPRLVTDIEFKCTLLRLLGIADPEHVSEAEIRVVPGEAVSVKVKRWARISDDYPPERITETFDITATKREDTPR